MRLLDCEQGRCKCKAENELVDHLRSPKAHHIGARIVAFLRLLESGVPVPPRDDAYSNDGGYWEELQRLIPRLQP